MGYFLIGVCAGSIITGMACYIVISKQLEDWIEEDEEKEMEEDWIEEDEEKEMEEDLTHDGWSDYN